MNSATLSVPGRSPSSRDVSSIAAPAVDGEIRRRTATWSALVVLCIAIRVALALSYDTVSADGAFFIRAARYLHEGDASLATAHRGFNVYPYILIGLHQGGLTYEAAGRIWGIIAATLTMLPLWVLFRAQFNERIALLALFLYAVHPGFIEWSVDPIRDSTFWLFFTTALCLLWQAGQSTSWRRLMAAVPAVAAAGLTRSEGWLLLIPLSAATLAAASRFKARKLLAAAGLIALAIGVGFPALLRAAPQWTERPLLVGVAEKWDVMWLKVRTMTGYSADTETEPASPLPWRKRAGNYAKRFCGAFHPVFGLLCLGGLLRHRHLLQTRAQVPIALMNFALLALVWIYLRRYGDMNTRYFYPIVLYTLPFAALGLVDLCDFARRKLAGRDVERYVWPAALSLLLVVGAASAATPNHNGRRDEAALGRWIAANCGAQCVVAEFGGHYLPAHYADAVRLATLTFPQGDGKQSALEIRSVWPEVVVARGKPEQLAAVAAFFELHPELPYDPVDLRGVVRADSGLAAYAARRPTHAAPE